MNVICQFTYTAKIITAHILYIIINLFNSFNQRLSLWTHAKVQKLQAKQNGQDENTINILTI